MYRRRFHASYKRFMDYWKRALKMKEKAVVYIKTISVSKRVILNIFFIQCPLFTICFTFIPQHFPRFSGSQLKSKQYGDIIENIQSFSVLAHTDLNRLCFIEELLLLLFWHLWWTPNSANKKEEKIKEIETLKLDFRKGIHSCLRTPDLKYHTHTHT